MRVVIDTNVFVSATRGGVPRQVIDLIDKGIVVLCISHKIVDEYIRVYNRLKITPLHHEKLLYYCEHADMVEAESDIPTLSLVKDDPDDDKFIECAVALRADYVITGDKALLSVKQFENIKIVTPREFLEILHSEE